MSVTDLAHTAMSQLAAAWRAGGSGLHDVAALIADAFGAGCVIYLRSDLHGCIGPVVGAHPERRLGEQVARIADPRSAWTGSPVADALARGESVSVSGGTADVAAHFSPTIAGFAHASDLRAIAAVPVRFADTVIAALLLGREGEDAAFSDDEHERLRALAGTLAEALDHERLARDVRRWREQGTSRRLAGERFRAAFGDATIGMLLFTLPPGRSTVQEANAALHRLLATTPEQLQEDRELNRFIHPDDVAHAQCAFAQLLTGDEPVADVDMRLLRADGTTVEAHVRYSLVCDADGTPVCGLAQVEDLSTLRRRERIQDALATLGRRALEVQEVAALEHEATALLADALELDAVLVVSDRCDAGELPRAPRVLDVIPRPWHERGIRSALTAPIGRDHRWLAALSTRERDLSHAELQGVEAAAHILAGATEREAAEQRALHDPLTGLPNRTRFADRVAHAIARGARAGEMLAIFSIDISRLKDVNDSLGRERGDELLHAVAQRLARIVRAADTLAHLGSDEFAILSEGIAGERGAIEIAERVVAAMAEPFSVDGHELHVAISVGVAVADAAGSSSESLLINADVALHRAKERPGSSYELFDRVMRRRVLARLELENDLRRALREQEFTLHYQPLVSLQQRRTVGVEALLRWEHPQRGLLTPAAFIQAAEESGLIVPLGSWVLNEACRRLARWGADPELSSLSMSVNLSTRQVAAPELAETVADTLQRTGVDPGALQLELTESVLMEETASPAAVLQRLRELGVRLALDDFGTGYSSLTYIKRFPLDAIKVDRAFIAGIADHESDRHIVRAIVNMAAALDVTVVAEGVELPEQASWLAAMGCQLAQGYALARPAPAEAIEPLLRHGLPPDRLSWTLEPAMAATEEPIGERLPLDLLETTPQQEATVPLSEAAQALGVSLSTLRRWADTGRIAAVRTPGGHRRFSVEEVRRLASKTGTAQRTSLRLSSLPEDPLPELATALDGELVSAAARSVYEPRREGWLTSADGAAALAQWGEAVAAACREGDYDGALGATRRLASRADYAATSVLERQLLFERVEARALGAVLEQRVPNSVVADVRRLFLRMRHTILEG